MNRYALATIAILSAVPQAPLHSQTASASRRTHELASLFSKEKHVVKEKHGVRVEKYKNVVASPVVPANPATFSGTYRDLNFDFVIRLQVSPDGTVTGTGIDPIDHESRISRPYSLTGAKIDGALLTATKVYRDGKRERLEGIFIERTSYESPEDRGTTVFGLGVISRSMQIDGNTIDRLFYERTAGQVAQGNTGSFRKGSSQ